MSVTPGTMEPTAPGGLFSGYHPPANAYDEVLLEGGGLRGPWPRFVSGVESVGEAGWAQRCEQARRLLRENGVTYNVYGAPEGPDRPWELDPIPLLLAAEEWQRLAAALAQRVALLNDILADVYGPQELLHRGLLPPTLLYGHPGYLLPCHNVAVPSNVYLHLYAGHLARAPSGEWVVLADRTQGPAGAGYAVENRIITSRMLPHGFRSLYVERLAPFFMALRDTLLSIARPQRSQPRVVLLSPGPRSSTYFEDAYLARYLGYTLVEGGDLTVRSNEVFLKTLGGLLPVDVILRRIPDEDADPLELNPESGLGVPGLVQAVRSGKVAVANSLGSGFLEAPALMAFLPEICRALRGEELLLPSVPTWWCGRSADRNYVVEHLHELVIRPAFQHRAAAPVFGWKLTRPEREELRVRIHEQPGLYVGQAQVQRSTAPVWNGSSLAPWHVGLRTFAVSSEGGYRVMPGGLTRVSAGDDFLGESVSAGQSSKDVWVLSDQPVENVSLLRPARAAVELRRSVNDLSSRTADNLFWLGRHVERAEGMVRHLRSVVVRLTNDVAPAEIAELSLVAAALTQPQPTSGIVTSSGADAFLTFDELRSEVFEFVFDSQRVLGLSPALRALRHTASIVRDRLSVDSWRIVNQLDLGQIFPTTPTDPRLGDVLLLLNHLLNLLSGFSGLASESMTRGPGWRFLDMGRRIERGLQTLGLVRGTIVPANGEPTPLLECLLEIADSTMTYRYRYLASLQLAPVLDLILIDETNPRAVGFQFSVLAEHMRQLPGNAERRAEQRDLLAAQGALRLCDVDALSEPDPNGERGALARFLDELAVHLRHVSDGVTRQYLTLTSAPRRLGAFAHHAEVIE